MGASFDPTLFWLFLLAIPVGLFAVVIGASQFLSIPIFQLFFPQMTLGAIVGNLRIGNMLRDAIALIPVRKDIKLASLWSYIVVICIGSVLGTLATANIPQWVLLPILLLAVMVTEAAPYISRYVHRHALTAAFFLTGVYYGIIGAGGSVISLAFLRIRFPSDKEIHAVRVHMLLLEFSAFAVSVAAFILTGKIDWRISLTWAAGAMIGGYVGGIVLKRTGKAKPKTQIILLRTVYVIAIAVAAWRAFA
jgi:uncharacterized membrane protein YfcA